MNFQTLTMSSTSQLNMQLYLYGLAAIFVVPSYGSSVPGSCDHDYCDIHPYPTYAHCDQRIISSIEAHWEKSGKPEHVIQTLEENGLFTLLHTSYEYCNDHKCIFLKFANSSLTTTLVPKEGHHLIRLYYKLEECDGVITGIPRTGVPAHNFKFYTVILADGVVLNYVCSDIEGSREPSLGGIILADKHKNCRNSSTLAECTQLLNSWHLDINHKYGNECGIN